MTGIRSTGLLEAAPAVGQMFKTRKTLTVRLKETQQIHRGPFMNTQCVQTHCRVRIRNKNRIRIRNRSWDKVENGLKNKIRIRGQKQDQGYCQGQDQNDD